jgi:hypothetical protein
MIFPFNCCCCQHHSELAPRVWVPLELDDFALQQAQLAVAVDLVVPGLARPHSVKYHGD